MTGEVARAVRVEINGTPYEAVAPARQLLIHFLRDTLGLRGPHIGCDTGNCGACTVRWNGKIVKSCMVLAVQADGSEIETVEGLAGQDGEPHPLQRCFADHHALQCGYCTPGMLIAAKDFLEHNPSPSEDEIRRALKGNLCRCTGYENIVRAIQAAAAAEGAAR